jgi:hypothetical protein
MPMKKYAVLDKPSRFHKKHQNARVESPAVALGKIECNVWTPVALLYSITSATVLQVEAQCIYGYGCTIQCIGNYCLVCF